MWLAWDAPAVRELVSLRDIADALDVCPGTLAECRCGHRPGYCGFPAPAVRIAGTDGWHRADVERWLRRSWCVRHRFTIPLRTARRRRSGLHVLRELELPGRR